MTISRSMVRRASGPTLLALLIGGSGVIAASAAPTSPVAAVSDSSDVVGAVAKFHAALAAGDSTAALGLLTPDALIVEGGAVETRADYRAHHLPADIQFARAVPATRALVRVTVQGDVAWVVSTSVSQGESNGRMVNSAGAELVVLRRGTSGWQISAVHWSSRTRQPPG